MAGRKRHLVDIGGIPRGDDQPSREWVFRDLLKQPSDLVDRAAVGLGPGAPLPAVDRAELALLIRPFIPYRDAVFLEIGDVGVPFEEPQKLVDDRLQMQLLRRNKREALRKVEAHLVPENRLR